jgi:hypothetical protein
MKEYFIAIIVHYLIFASIYPLSCEWYQCHHIIRWTIDIGCSQWGTCVLILGSFSHIHFSVSLVWIALSITQWFCMGSKYWIYSYCLHFIKLPSPPHASVLYYVSYFKSFVAFSILLDVLTLTSLTQVHSSMTCVVYGKYTKSHAYQLWY